MSYRVGIDIGSTTVKVVVLDSDDRLLYRSYERHYSRVREKAAEQLSMVSDILSGEKVKAVITGSAGLGVSKASGISFVQEVYATGAAVREYIPDADAVIELGGEDAKIIFFTGGLEERMNGSCAGGTGAFIDQMATLLDVSVEELDELYYRHERIYPIASRCGVFAKSDIQPILNQGGRKEDIAASIYQAVVDQTVSGLTQGKELKGKIVFLGGPLHFLSGLRERFVETLELDKDNAVFPENSECFAAIGAALCAADYPELSYEELLASLESSVSEGTLTDTMPPLFENEEEYEQFRFRHSKAAPDMVEISEYSGKAYLGIDAGSTTTKMVLITPEGGLLYTYYGPNKGNPVTIVLEKLIELYELCGDRVEIVASAVTGYGEELIKNAFNIDLGLVETIAHYKAAQYFDPKVDFIIDIGGQDMKCFKIRNGAVDSIMLNEACSSGCGSFIESFAKALGYEIQEFAELGIMDKSPVNLGSRCTVFMNSSVKQAQKEGASIEDISAGLSISIVKNAIYKVIRASSPDDLGKNIVVQGGTFLNDAVLRCFEMEIGRNVTRPAIAGLMGAYGAALYAARSGLKQSGILKAQELYDFHHEAKPSVCNGCTNRCSLTVNTFTGRSRRRFISGNRCSKPLGREKANMPNMFRYKLERLTNMQGTGSGDGSRGRLGIPFGLNMYENLPFWFTFFTKLNFEVVLSPVSSRELYKKGQHTIPSDTVCYPAKLMHGHIEALMDMDVDYIFYPCMSYNFDEGKGDNNYNCPVVAYYPELLLANIQRLKDFRYLNPYVGLHRPKDFKKRISRFMHENFSVPAKETVEAARAAYEAYESYRSDIIEKGRECIEFAREHGKNIIVVSGRPYHIDPEISHGIDELIGSLDLVLITEDCVAHHVKKESRNVLNQWTYQARMYDAARYVCTQPDMQLVQLVSFGCGTDAITTDELREILERGGKLYTPIKIDDINNLGAIRIRIRSLVAAIEARKE
ncbi:MAG: 2-hydroxyglutaryl-CoA dehydratase [Clostridiales bacterium]|jgi:predicted CoA-substrate-specific enzyme activase|nr:2-hydroxyglutaryl-CoA dehydratase [Clostridiales bacterium]